MKLNNLTAATSPLTTDSKTILKPWRRTLCKVLAPLYMTTIFGLPSAAIVGLWTNLQGTWTRFGLAVTAPMLFTFLFCLIAGLLSLPHRKGIVAGKFPRDVAHPVYFDRRMYGLCWTSLFYFKPVYYLCLQIPSLKKMTFRLFGYQGSMDFTIYPDTWIRDLPLLSFGEGAYIANRSTLGTNLCLPNGQIMVGKVSVGKNALVGHLVAIACDSSLGDGSEIGACAAVGYKSTIGANVHLAGRCVVEHGVQIGDGASVGTAAYVGSASRIATGVAVLPGSNVPPRTKLKTSEEASSYAAYLGMERTRRTSAEQNLAA